MFGLVRPYYKKMIKQEKCEYKVNGKPHTWSKKSAVFSGGEY